MQERKQGCICELNAETGEPVVENYGECPIHKPSVTPKDTAQNLVNLFTSKLSESGHSISKPMMKECAAVAVDEILSILDTFQTHAYAKVLIPHYIQVKEEIQKL